MKADLIIAEAAAEAAQRGGDFFSSFEVGLLRNQVTHLVAEIDAMRYVKEFKGYIYTEVTHQVLGVVTVGFEYTPEEAGSYDEPPFPEDASVHEVWVNGKDIYEALSPSLFDELAELVLKSRANVQRDNEMAYRRAA